MIIIYLTDIEKGLLQNYFKSSPIGLIRYKAQAILMRDNGLSIQDIGQSVIKSERTITRWIKDYSTRRMASIFSGLEDNENASKLTREQKEEIKTTLSSPPSDQKLPKEFWDVPQLKQWIKSEFGVVYESVQSYHYLLRFSNLSFKQPAVFDVRRDDETIRKRMIAIRKEIMPMIQSNEWEVLASDETRIMLEAITRRAWLTRGEKTVLKVERSNESQYYIGFLNLKSGRDHIKALKWGNQQQIIQSLEELIKLYPSKRICIIWDNVAFHKGSLLQDRLRKGQSLEQIHLINFPPYAPDCNPQEMIWNVGKGHIANRRFKNFAGTKRSFTRYISTKTFDYAI